MSLTDSHFWDEYWRDVKLPAQITEDGATPYQLAILNVLKAFLPIGTSFDILEVGGAPGAYLAYLASVFENARVSALDYSPVGCTSLKDNFGRLGLPLTVYERDLLTSDLGTMPKFDVVYSLGLIEHFDDVRTVIERHVEVTKPGGVVIVGAPSFLGVNKPLMKLFNRPALEWHNLRAMDVRTWKPFEEALNLTTLFRGYVGGWEPRLYVRSGRSPARLLTRALWMSISRLLDAFPATHRLDSRWWSGYVMAVYRTPA